MNSEQPNKTLSAANTLKPKKLSEVILTQLEEMILEGKNTSQNITIGIGAVISLVGVLGLLRIIILQLNFIETIAAEPFLIVIGLLVMAYAMFIEDYD